METQLLEEYNSLLVRFKMGVLYLESTEGSEIFIPAFQKLTIELDKALQNIKGFNIEVTDNEVIEGFHIEFRIARYNKYNY